MLGILLKKTSKCWEYVCFCSFNSSPAHLLPEKMGPKFQQRVHLNGDTPSNSWLVWKGNSSMKIFGWWVGVYPYFFRNPPSSISGDPMTGHQSDRWKTGRKQGKSTDRIQHNRSLGRWGTADWQPFLVGGFWPPLGKIWLRQLGWWKQPNIYGKIKHRYFSEQNVE